MTVLVNRYRIVLVGPMPPTKGGITTFMLNLMASPLSRTFEFLTYSTSRPVKKNVINNYGYSAVLRGGVVRIAYGIILTLTRLFYFPFFLAIRRVELVQVQASDYQVFWEGIAYVLFGRLCGLPTILRIGGHFDRFHSTSGKFAQQLIARSLLAADSLIVQSEFTRKYVQEHCGTKNILVLPNWTRDDVKFDPAVRPSMPCPTALFIANSEAVRKGVNEVLQVIADLDRMRAPVQFHLCALAPRLILKIGKMGVSNVKATEGLVDHEYLLQLMKTTDIFLLPSHGEGFPNSLIEAMAAGMASIVTPVAAVPEIVNGGGAITIPVGDAAALRNAICVLAEDEGLRKRLGTEAQNTIKTRYTPEVVLQWLEERYHFLIERRHRKY